MDLSFWGNIGIACAMGFPGGSDGKNPPSMQKTRVWSLCQKIPWRREWLLNSSILAWRIPRTEEPGGLESMESQNSDRTEQLTLTHISNWYKAPRDYAIMSVHSWSWIQYFPSLLFGIVGAHVSSGEQSCVQTSIRRVTLKSYCSSFCSRITKVWQLKFIFNPRADVETFFPFLAIIQNIWLCVSHSSRIIKMTIS